MYLYEKEEKGYPHFATFFKKLFLKKAKKHDSL
jgi:hypothetical protein